MRIASLFKQIQWEIWPFLLDFRLSSLFSDGLLGIVALLTSFTAPILPAVATFGMLSAVINFNAASLFPAGLGYGLALLSTAIVSGSLQVSATIFPENRRLTMANSAFGLINGFGTLLLGGYVISSGIIAALAVRSCCGRVAAGVLILSGTNTAFSGAAQTASAGMGVGGDTRQPQAGTKK